MQIGSTFCNRSTKAGEDAGPIHVFWRWKVGNFWTRKYMCFWQGKRIHFWADKIFFLVWHSTHSDFFRLGGLFYKPNYSVGPELESLTWVHGAENLSPFDAALLQNVDDYTYCRAEWEFRKVRRVHIDICLIGNEEVMHPFTMYNCESMFEPTEDMQIIPELQLCFAYPVREGDTTFAACMGEHMYPYHPIKTSVKETGHPVTCAMHVTKVAEQDGPDLFDSIRLYLSEGIVPEGCADGTHNRVAFVQKLPCS